MGLLDLGGSGKKNFDILTYIGADNSQFTQVVESSGKKGEFFGDKMNKTMNRALMAGTAAFTAITVAAMRFETQMALVDTLLAGADRTVETLSKDTLKYMTTSASSMQVTTKALYDTISASIPASQALEVVGLSAKAAAAGFTTVEVAGRAGIANMNSYAMQVEDLTKIFDLQFSAVKYGVMTYEELASGIGMVLPAAKNLNVSLEDMYGSLAFLTKAGQSTHFATTNLSRAFQDLVQKQDKLAKFDISIWDKQTGKFLGMENVIGQLSEALKGMTDQQRNAALQVMNFDVRSGRAITSMVNNYESYVKTLHNVANSTGAMNEGYQAVSMTFERQAKIIKNIVQVAYIEMGNKTKSALNGMLLEINKHPEAVMAMVKAFTELILVLGSVGAAYKIVSVAHKLLQVNPIILSLTALAAVIVALKNMTDAYRRSIINKIEATSDDIKEVEQLKKEYDALSAGMSLNSKEATRYGEVYLKLTDKLKAAGLSTDALKKSTAELSKEYKAARIADLEKQIRDLTVATDLQANKTSKWYNIYTWGEKGVLKDYQNRLVSLRSEYDELTTSTNFLNEAGIKTEKQIRAQITAYEAELAGLDKTSYEYDKLAKKIEALKVEIGDVVAPTEKLKTNIEKLKDAGVVFVADLEKQIEALTKLKGVYADNSSIVFQLELKIKELQKALKESIPPDEVEQIKEIFDSFEDVSLVTTRLTSETGQLAGVNAQVGDSFVDTNDKLKDTKETVDDTAESWYDYANYVLNVIDSMNSFGPEAKQVLSLFGQLWTAIERSGTAADSFSKKLSNLSNFDIFSLSISAISLGAKALIDNFKSAAFELKSFSELLPILSERLKTVNDNLGDMDNILLVDKVTSFKNRIDELTKYYEQLNLRLKLYGDQWGNLREHMANVEAEILKVTLAYEQLMKTFTSKNLIEKTLENMAWLFDEVYKSWLYLGGAVDLTPILDTLFEQFDATFLLLTGIADKTSPAFKDLLAAMIAGIAKMRAMGLEGERLDTVIDSLTAYLLKLGFSLEEINRMLGLNTDEIDENIEARKRAEEQHDRDIADMKQRKAEHDYLGDGIDDDTDAEERNREERHRGEEQHDRDVADMKQRKAERDFLKDATDEDTDALDRNRKARILDMEIIKRYAGVYKEAKKYIDGMNDSYEDTEKIIDGIYKLNMNIAIDNWKAFTAQLDASFTAIEEMLFFGIDPALTDIDEKILHIMWNMGQYLEDINPNSPAYAQARSALIELIKRYLEMGAAIPAKLMQYFIDLLGVDFLAILEKVRTGLQRFNEEIGKMADGIGETNDTFDELQKKMDGLTDLNINIAIENWETFTAQLAAANAAIDELLFFEIDLDTTRADENILRTIFNLTLYYDKLKAGSPAAEAAKKYIIELILNYMKLGKAIPIWLMEYFIEILGEDFIDAIDDADDKLKEFIDTWEEAADRIGGTNDKFEDVEFKLFPEDIEEGILKLRELADQVLSLAEYYGNTDFDGLTDSLIDQINAMQALLYLLDPTSQAYKDLQYEIYYANAVLWVLWGRIGSVEEFFEKLGIEMRELKRTFFDLSKGVIDFSYHWDLLTGKKVYQWDQFKTDMEEAMDLLAKFKFFKIDLETTDADEAIGQLILRMQAYLETLDPDSKAYKQFKRELDRLIKQFLAAGGIIPFELLDEFDDIDIDIEVDLADAIMELKDVLELLAKIIALAAGLDFDFGDKEAERKAKDLLEKLDKTPPKTPEEDVYWIGHQGGFVRAHSGYVVAGGKEVPALLEPGEVVLPKNIVKRHSPDEWRDIIAGKTAAASTERLTAQIDSLSQNMMSLFNMLGNQRPSDVKVVVNNPGLNTTLDLLQDYGEQWLRARERNRVHVGIFR